MEKKTSGDTRMKPDLNALLAKWQAIMRLQDWDVGIRYIRGYDMGNDLGRVTYTHTKKQANIRVLDPDDADPEWLPQQDIEQTVVHELLHLHMEPWHAEGTDHLLMEQAVDAISGTLINRDRATPITSKE